MPADLDALDRDAAHRRAVDRAGEKDLRSGAEAVADARLGVVAEAVVTGDHQLPATADGGIDALERGGPVGKGGLRERGSGDEGEEHSKAFHGGAAYPTSKSFGRSSPALPRRHSSKEWAFSGRSSPT